MIYIYMAWPKRVMSLFVIDCSVMNSGKFPLSSTNVRCTFFFDDLIHCHWHSSLALFGFVKEQSIREWLFLNESEQVSSFIYKKNKKNYVAPSWSTPPPQLCASVRDWLFPNESEDLSSFIYTCTLHLLLGLPSPPPLQPMTHFVIDSSCSLMNLKRPFRIY